MGSVLPDPFVAGGARVADVVAAQLPDDPICRFDPVIHALVELRILLEQLQCFGVLPLTRDEAAVASQPGLAPFGRDSVDPVGLRLGRVVLPQLHVGVRSITELGQLAQRSAVGEHRHRRRGGEVGGDADHPSGIDAGRRDRLGDGPAQHVAVVVGHLQGPVGWQRGTARPPARDASPRGSTRGRPIQALRRLPPARRVPGPTACRSRPRRRTCSDCSDRSDARIAPVIPAGL